MELEHLRLKGKAIETVLTDLADLRIKVFKAYPYLYEGSFEYEKEYLQTYIQSDKAFLFALYTVPQSVSCFQLDRALAPMAQDALKGVMVGATTCIPLTDETPEVQEPFKKAGLDIESIFYFGESLLLPTYRGQGIGHLFFDEREAHARSFGTFQTTCFCAVVRPDNHILKPENYRPLDEFWIKRGYQKAPHLESQFEWLDIGDAVSTKKTMVYWTYKL